MLVFFKNVPQKALQNTFYWDITLFILFPHMRSSISEILQLCAEDAEETLYELGFGRDEPQVTVRIPPRFLNFPSLSRGINFRVFLDSQIRRIREEDPSLSLASKTIELLNHCCWLSLSLDCIFVFGM